MIDPLVLDLLSMPEEIASVELSAQTATPRGEHLEECLKKTAVRGELGDDDG